METQGRANVAFQVQMQSAVEFPLVQRMLIICSFQVYNWYDEAHPHYGGQFALLKVHQLNC